MDTQIKQYNPSEDEEYMNSRQLKYFQSRLLCWREELLQASWDMFTSLKENEVRNPDLVDMGTNQAESERSLSTYNRRNSLLVDIEHALRRIKDGNYGYCEMTGEEVGLKRLMVMPLATLCVEAKQRLEQMRSVRYH